MKFRVKGPRKKKKKGTARTKVRRTTQGARTSTEKAAEIKRGGVLCSGRKVCLISGRGWNEASRGCTGAGCDFGRTRSKRSRDIGSYLSAPIKSVTFNGSLLGVGGRDGGGLLRF